MARTGPDQPKHDRPVEAGAARGDATGRLSVRGLEAHAELLELEELQREVWGLGDIEVVPSAQIRAVLHGGGRVAGAFLDDELVGFSYGFLARPHGRGMEGLGLHSHMVAVRARARGRGVGRALKWDQRAWSLARGLGWISWTFDPLQARNANLNLRHLGAVGAEYLVDFYGPMGGPLGGGQPTDRLLAVWQLGSERVTGLAAGARYPDPPAFATAPLLLGAGPGGRLAEPEPREVDRAAVDAGRPVRVAVPVDVTYLMAEAPELARRWRAAVGNVMVPLFDAGYAAVQALPGGYVLAPFPGNRRRDLTE